MDKLPFQSRLKAAEKWFLKGTPDDPGYSELFKLLLEMANRIEKLERNNPKPS